MAESDTLKEKEPVIKDFDPDILHKSSEDIQKELENKSNTLPASSESSEDSEKPSSEQTPATDSIKKPVEDKKPVEKAAEESSASITKAELNTIIDDSDTLKSTDAYITVRKIAKAYADLALNPNKLTIESIAQIVTHDKSFQKDFRSLLEIRADAMQKVSRRILKNIDENNGLNIDDIIAAPQVSNLKELIDTLHN